MQDVAQLSTLSRGIEAPSLSSSSAEKNPYINFEGVKEVFGDTIEIDYIRWLHSSKIKSGLVEASLIDSERQSVITNSAN